MVYPRNTQMLSLNEHKELSEAIQSMDAQFTDDVINQAEYFEIEEDPVTLQTIVTVFDTNGAPVTSANCEDYDTALYYMEEVFDLDWNDDEDADDEAAAVGSRFGHA